MQNEEQNAVVPFLVPEIEGTITTVAEAVALRDELVKEADAIQAVTGEVSQRLAVAVVSKIKGTLSFVEAYRVKKKESSLERGRAIDRSAKEFVEPLSKHLERLDGKASGLITQFQREQLRKQREAEAAQQRALDDQARKQREEDARRLAAIEAGKPAPPPAPAARFAPIPIVPVPVKAAGQSLGTKWDYRVLDLKKVYAARPDLCRLEISPAAVKAALSNGLRECDGLEIFEDVKSQIKAT